MIVLIIALFETDCFGRQPDYAYFLFHYDFFPKPLNNDLGLRPVGHLVLHKDMMMEIHVSIPDDGRETFVHCFRNFGEEVYRALSDFCAISIHEIDTSVDHFRIGQIPKEELSQVCNIIRDIAEKHFFAETIQLKQVSAKQ